MSETSDPLARILAICGEREALLTQLKEERRRITARLAELNAVLGPEGGQCGPRDGSQPSQVLAFLQQNPGSLYGEIRRAVEGMGPEVLYRLHRIGRVTRSGSAGSYRYYAAQYKGNADG